MIYKYHSFNKILRRVPLVHPLAFPVARHRLNVCGGLDGRITLSSCIHERRTCTQSLWMEGPPPLFELFGPLSGDGHLVELGGSLQCVLPVSSRYERIDWTRRIGDPLTLRAIY